MIVIKVTLKNPVCICVRIWVILRIWMTRCESVHLYGSVQTCTNLCESVEIYVTRCKSVYLYRSVWTYREHSGHEYATKPIVWVDCELLTQFGKRSKVKTIRRRKRPHHVIEVKNLTRKSAHWSKIFGLAKIFRKVLRLTESERTTLFVELISENVVQNSLGQCHKVILDNTVLNV